MSTAAVATTINDTTTILFATTWNINLRAQLMTLAKGKAKAIYTPRGII
jgi:hypothetical protein